MAAAGELPVEKLIFLGYPLHPPGKKEKLRDSHLYSIRAPMLFFAGVWIPRSIMSDTLLTISDLTPVGSAVQALEDAWYGTTPNALNLLVMAGWAVVVGLLAIRMFRWE